VDADCTRTFPRLALGTWALAGDDPFGYGPCPRAVAVATIEAALAAGCRRFDTATAFAGGAVERLLGEVLRGTGVAVTTRVGFTRVAGRPLPDFSPEGLAAQVEASAARLGMSPGTSPGSSPGSSPIDRVLLYTPSASTLRHGRAVAALLEMKAKGLAREIGVSVNEPAEARMALQGGVDWICVPYNAANRKFEGFLSDATRSGVRVQIREALHNGLLAEAPPTVTGLSPRDLRRRWPAAFLEAMADVRDRMRPALPGVDVTAAALGYVLGHPHVDEVVVGCRGRPQVRAAFAARPLDPGERERLEAAVYRMGRRSRPPLRASASMASISASDSP
jgi:aryl-alcohol dehydrogenase-like predicted oxidoreductase